MPRPKKFRYVEDSPAVTEFAPRNRPAAGEVTMSIEELETIRLSDFEQLDQETAANRMQVSRHTYGRILARARAVAAEALVTGKALIVTGGHYRLRGRQNRCRNRGVRRQE